jgi:hypothetical protein
MELLSGENRTWHVKPTLFAPVTLAAVFVWACGGNVSAPIAQQADSIEDAAPPPAPDPHVSFNFDAASTPVSVDPDAGAGQTSANADAGSAPDATTPPTSDAAPPGAVDSGASSSDTGAPSSPPGDATVPPPPPPPPPPPSMDASSSDDAATFVDVGISEDTGPGNGGPPAPDSGTMTCTDDGQDCSADSECCTGLCLSFGSCGACIAVTGLCLTDSDCCDGHCNLQSNACM